MDPKVEFLFLSQQEMIAAGVLEMDNCVDVLDRAFKLLGRGDFLMGGPSGNHHGLKLFFPREPRGPQMPTDGPDRRFMALISYLGGHFHVCGTKWYGSNIENPLKGLPRSILLVIVNDPDTGAPLAIMDGNLVSAMRTGAAIGLGAKYLVRTDAQVAGIIAAGVISKTCLMALAVSMPNLKEVKVFDIDRQKAETFSRKMTEKLGIDIYPVENMEDAVRDSDAVSSATSRVKVPHFKSEWFKPGSFLGLSSDASLDDEYWLDAKIVADYWKMHLEWREETLRIYGDTSKMTLYNGLHQLILDGRMKDDDVLEMGKVVNDGIAAKENEKQRIIYITGGMGIEDTAWGYTIYQQAKSKGLGQKLKLWDQSYWL